MPATKRMTLQRPNWPDVDDVAALSTDAEAMRFSRGGEPMTAAHVLAVEMPRLMADSGRLDQLGCWVARKRSTGGFLGWFSLAPVDGSAGTVALDYRLSPGADAQGYAVEGLLQLLEVARTAQVSTIVAQTSAGDVDGRAVLERIGLAEVRAVVDSGPAREAHAIDYRLDLQVGASIR